jgi:transcriptional regulator with XRE-family HTH domain
MTSSDPAELTPAGPELDAFRLRQARRAAGLTQAELAAKAGCHASLIGLIETAHPSGRKGAESRHKIAAALGREASELFPSTLDPEASAAG